MLYKRQNIYNVPNTIEALTTMNVADDVLLRVGQDYKLYEYSGTN